MTSSERPRSLRPGLLVAVGARVWVVDRTQPVALVLDAVGAERVALVGWSRLPAGPSPERRVVLPGHDALWVQQHGGPVVRVDERGNLTGHYVSDAVLGAVSAHGAWCAPEPRSQDLAAASDAPPSDPRSSTQLRLARASRPTRTVHVDAPVRSLRGVDGDLFVEVETGAWTRRSLGTPTSWDLEVDTSWLRLTADEDDVPAVLSAADHACGPPPPADAQAWWHRLPRRRDLVEGEDGEPVRPHARTADLDWFAGVDPELAAQPAQVFAVAYEAGTTRERWRVPLGVGAVTSIVASHEQLWVTVEQPPNGPYRPTGPAGVVRVDAATGRSETVVGPGSVDIATLAWPLGQPPVDDADYTAFWRHQLESLDAYWTDQDGHVGPLSEGLSGTRVDVVGAWPDTALHVTFDWTRRPESRLRRTVALYDDLGRPEEPLYADIHIMEDLDTGHVPAQRAPGSDHLDF